MALHTCRFEELGADWAAATSNSRVPAGSASGRKSRTERCENRVSSTGLKESAATVAAAPYRACSNSKGSDMVSFVEDYQANCQSETACGGVTSATGGVSANSASTSSLMAAKA